MTHFFTNFRTSYSSVVTAVGSALVTFLLADPAQQGVILGILPVEYRLKAIGIVAALTGLVRLYKGSQTADASRLAALEAKVNSGLVVPDAANLAHPGDAPRVVPVPLPTGPLGPTGVSSPTGPTGPDYVPASGDHVPHGTPWPVR